MQIGLYHLCNLAQAYRSFSKALKKFIVHPIFERIMNSWLVDFLESNNLLAPTQYASSTDMSPTDPVHYETNYIITYG